MSVTTLYAPDWRAPTKETATTQHFVRVPTTLLPADPRLRGIWALVARLFILERGPVPLSAADLGAYDPSLSYGAVSRLLGQLVRDGWLLPQTRRGQKTCYTPSWGAGRPMILSTAHHHKPRRLATVPLPAQLLDVFLGKLTPRMDAPATIARYTSEPLLTLADVGVYVQALTGVPATTAVLEQYGLIQHKQVCQLPTIPTTLARVTQQTLEGKRAVYLTQAGAHVLGVPRPAPSPPCPTPGPQPLFFVERGVIDHLIDHLIGSSEYNDTFSDLSRSGKNSDDESTKTITWSPWIHESTNHESPHQRKSHAGGGVVGDDTRSHPESPPHAMPTHLPKSSRRELDITNKQLNPDRPILPGEWLELATTHRRLNPDRPILPGEWLELATLAQEHGLSALLIWQSRAQRAGCPRVTPSYYHACAAQAALATYRPPRATVPQTLVSAPPISAAPPRAPVVSDQPPATVPDAGVIEQLGTAAGEPVRCPQLLAGVAPALITAWTQVVGHAGLRARFADPLGFALTQLRRGIQPPPTARLEAWSASTPTSPTPWTPDDLTSLHQDYGDLFRLGSGQSLPQHQAPVLPPRPHRPKDTLVETATSPAQHAPIPPREHGVQVISAPSARGISPPQLNVTEFLPAVQSALRLRAGRGPLRALLDRVTFDLRPETLLITCRSVAHLTQVQSLLLPLLPTVLAECGVSVRVQVMVRPSHGHTPHP